MDYDVQCNGTMYGKGIQQRKNLKLRESEWIWMSCNGMEWKFEGSYGNGNRLDNVQWNSCGMDWQEIIL